MLTNKKSIQQSVDQFQAKAEKERKKQNDHNTYASQLKNIF